MSDVQHAFWVRNAEKDPVVLCLEPWADETLLAGGKDYLVVFEGPPQNWPAIQWSKDRITAYGWSGSIAAVYLEGQLLMNCSTRVPMMPGSPS